ncbi:alpha-L-fucosidase [Flavivirga eckloniae]|uniref:alpha-L-fucosidase n=1 Tax=Flavivirga eckloniae TaxID=1803846 RepID=A0A2K9PLV1_9FLAO|nr:alpha-L-fucosidase [Flavivirga eckloniae]AUP78006.1 alpha-L-fucosidase [Flavivirga eckloniae]
MIRLKGRIYIVLVLSIALTIASCNNNKAKTDSKKVIFEPTWESLATHNTEPEWFKDSKFGIYFHWGLFTVPEYYDEKYPRWMYFEKLPVKGWGGPVRPYHNETYGGIENFNYHDFIPMFKAEKFNAAAWVDLFELSGAKFAGPVAQHHDGFAMWDSEVNPFNAKDKGPHKDITGELFEELKNRNIKTIATFHHARNLARHAKDTTQWADKCTAPMMSNNSYYPYHPQLITSTKDPELKYLYGNLSEQEFNDYWLNQVNEVVDKYAPDMIWFDSWLHLIPENHRKKMVAHHFNSGINRGQEPVVFYKQQDLPNNIGLLDIEQGGKKGISEQYWLTDITITKWGWSYTDKLECKSAEMLIRNMIDVWSKKGVVLLNVSPRASGAIPNEQQDVLKSIGSWIKKHKEAVYGTRTHTTYGYGIAASEDNVHGGQSATMKYTKDDIRFTTSKDKKTLYIYILGLPDEKMNIEIRHVIDNSKNQSIKNVALVGSKTEIKWSIDGDNLTVTTPEASEMDEIATVFKVAFK